MSSPFLDEENGDSGYREHGALDLHSPQALKDEANFLKAWGTIPETPMEIRKACEKVKRSPSCDGDSGSLKIHSWLPETCIKELQSEEKIDQFSTAIEIYEELGTSASEQTPSSCISNVATSEGLSISVAEGNEAMISDATSGKVDATRADIDETPASPWPSAPSVPGKIKSVRFECDFDVSSSKGSSDGSGSQSSRRFETPGNRSVTKPFPHPTPLKLSDEMQTPGTVYPSNPSALVNGKHRIRSQYVYSVLNPVDDTADWIVTKDEDSVPKEMSGELEDSFEELITATPKPEPGGKNRKPDRELSLSHWLKARPQAQNEVVPPFGRTPGDRPIIGMVAAHWNENEATNIAPKWDGNGIPNTTTKYKEDQKVSWHATPFEERLEKVLSAENVNSQRNRAYPTPIAFDEADEADTASSLLQPSSSPVSV